MKGIGRIAKEAWILKRMEHGESVLHVGCTNSPNMENRLRDGTLLHAKLLAHRNDVIGLDIDKTGCARLAELFPDAKFSVCDVHELDKMYQEGSFDLIIAADLLEHLDNPGVFLQASGKVLARDGEIIITTSNTYSVQRFCKALLFHEAVHEEHTAYYSPSTLSRLARMNGFVIKEYGYYKGEPIAGWDWNRVVSNIIESVAGAVWPQLSEGVVCIFRKTE